MAHPTRRLIIRIVQSKSGGVSYTELITGLGLSTGKLNYHLDQLKGVLEKTNSGYYVLSPFGKKAVEHLNLVEQRSTPEDEKYVKIAVLSQKNSLQPIIKAFLLISIAMMVVFLALWIYIGYISLLEGAPTVVFVLLPVLIIIAICVIGVLLYSLVRAPSWMRRFEQRFFGEP